MVSTNQSGRLVQHVQYYQQMLRIRRCEERIGWLFSRNLTMGTAHLSIGQEACAVGVLAAAEPGDYAVSTHRGHGHLLAKGASPAQLLAEICGRASGFCQGKGGSQHIAVRDIGFLGTNGITGGGLPVATGAALSIKLRRSGQVVLCFFGDGAANQGTFHESLNMAAVWRLPIVYVCENNGYAMYTRTCDVTSVADVAARAPAYGMPGVTVDGMDVLAVREAAREAIARARAGDGPTLLQAQTYRLCGHSKSDNGRYRDQDELARWEARDPLVTWRAHLLVTGASEAALQAIEAAVEAEMDEAVRVALDSPYAVDEALVGAYAEGPATAQPAASAPQPAAVGAAPDTLPAAVGAGHQFTGGYAVGPYPLPSPQDSPAGLATGAFAAAAARPGA